jgi:hypothetical protein
MWITSYVGSYGSCVSTMIIVSINMVVRDKCDPYDGNLIIYIKSFNL